MRGILALCGVSLVASGAACSRPRAEAPPGDTLTVSVAKVVRGDVAQILNVAGEFRPYQEIDVHAKVAGYLKSIQVDVGDRVKAGQLLAVLEIPELEDELRQDEASIKHATEEIHRADADLARAESTHEMAHLASTRLASASQARPNLIAQQDLDDAVGRDKVAEAQVSTARASIASAHEQLAVTQANRSKTATLFGYARITAPFDGVITHRFADTGAMIQAGTSSQTQTMPLVRLSQNSLLRLIIPVPESAASRIHDKGRVDVRVDAIGRTFPGTVARLSERLDTETRTMRVEVDVPNPKLELLPGMFAQVSIALSEAKDALTVPIQTIDRVGDRARVLVVTDQRKVEARDVRLGLESADRVVVTDGLREGELVVTGNRGQLRPGTTVAAKVQDNAPSGSER